MSNSFVGYQLGHSHVNYKLFGPSSPGSPASPFGGLPRNRVLRLDKFADFMIRRLIPAVRKHNHYDTSLTGVLYILAQNLYRQNSLLDGFDSCILGAESVVLKSFAMEEEVYAVGEQLDRGL